MFGEIDHIGIAVEDLDDSVALYRDRLGMREQHRETVERDSRRDRWFSAEDALAYGFVDQVITSVDHVTPASQRPVGLAGVR